VLAVAVPVLAVAVSVADAVFLLDVLRATARSIPPYLTAEDVAGKAAFSALVCWIATIPAFVLLWLAARRAGVRPSSLVIVAAVAVLVVGINGGRLQGLVFPPFSLVGSFDWDLLLLTPLVEEVLKVLAVGAVMVASGARKRRAGIVLGAAAGLGMTAFETAHYINAAYLLETSVWFGTLVALRFALLGLGMHAAATALAGLGLGAWLERGRRRADLWMPFAGLLGAVGVHVTWNAVADAVISVVLDALIPAGGQQGPIDSFTAASITSTLLLVVPWMVLIAAWRRSGPRAVAGPPLPDAEATLPAPLPPPA
jgi:RsiW-degrading membrane proteinase PrsW (M82 family)